MREGNWERKRVREGMDELKNVRDGGENNRNPTREERKKENVETGKEWKKEQMPEREKRRWANKGRLETGKNGVESRQQRWEMRKKPNLPSSIYSSPCLSLQAIQHPGASRDHWLWGINELYHAPTSSMTRLVNPSLINAPRWPSWTTEPQLPRQDNNDLRWLLVLTFTQLPPLGRNTGPPSLPPHLHQKDIPPFLHPLVIQRIFTLHSSLFEYSSFPPFLPPPHPRFSRPPLLPPSFFPPTYINGSKQ